jgi:hypothetical protein
VTGTFPLLSPGSRVEGGARAEVIV